VPQEELDSSNKGYQPPLDESLVKEFDPEAPWEVDGAPVELSKNAWYVDRKNNIEKII